MSLEDNRINQIKVKRLLEGLSFAEGSGTSMITYLIKPGSSVDIFMKRLNVEFANACRIKSRV